MSKRIKIGDTVTPKTIAGLCLADVPTDGDYYQKLQTTCVFIGEGTVIATHDVIIDYDSWPDSYDSIGKIEYRSCLVKCSNGEGWGGEGALVKVSKDK